MKTLSISIIFAVLTLLILPVNSYSQTQSAYQIKNFKGDMMIIGEKEYKKLEACEGFAVGDYVSFSESPITCLQATIVNLMNLKECKVESMMTE